MHEMRGGAFRLFLPQIYVAKRLKAAYGLVGKSYKNTAITGKSFKVGMALAVKIRAHLLNLESVSS